MGLKSLFSPQTPSPPKDRRYVDAVIGQRLFGFGPYKLMQRRAMDDQNKSFTQYYWGDSNDGETYGREPEKYTSSLEAAFTAVERYLKKGDYGWNISVGPEGEFVVTLNNLKVKQFIGRSAILPEAICLAILQDLGEKFESIPT